MALPRDPFFDDPFFSNTPFANSIPGMDGNPFLPKGSTGTPVPALGTGKKKDPGWFERGFGPQLPEVTTGLGAPVDAALNFADRYIGQPLKKGLNVFDEALGTAVVGARWGIEDIGDAIAGTPDEYKRLVAEDRRKEYNPERLPSFSEEAAGALRQAPNLGPEYDSPTLPEYGAGQTAGGRTVAPDSYGGALVQAGGEFAFGLATDPSMMKYAKAAKALEEAVQAGKVASKLAAAGVQGAEQQLIGAQKALRAAQQMDVGTGVASLPSMVEGSAAAGMEAKAGYEREGFTPKVFQDTLSAALPAAMIGAVGADIGRFRREGFAKVPESFDEAQASIDAYMQVEDPAGYDARIQERVRQRPDFEEEFTPPPAPLEPPPVFEDELPDLSPAIQAARPFEEEFQVDAAGPGDAFRARQAELDRIMQERGLLQPPPEAAPAAPPLERSLIVTPEEAAAQPVEAGGLILPPGFRDEQALAGPAPEPPPPFRGRVALPDDFQQAVQEALQGPVGGPRLVDGGVDLSPAARAAARQGELEGRMAGPLLDETGGDPLQILRTLGGEARPTGIEGRMARPLLDEAGGDPLQILKTLGGEESAVARETPQAQPDPVAGLERDLAADTQEKQTARQAELAADPEAAIRARVNPGDADLSTAIDRLPPEIQPRANQEAESRYKGYADTGKMPTREEFTASLPEDLRPHAPEIYEETMSLASARITGEMGLETLRDHNSPDGPDFEVTQETSPGTYDIVQRATVNGERKVVGGALIHGGSLSMIVGGKEFDSPVSMRPVREALDRLNVSRNNLLTALGKKSRRRELERALAEFRAQRGEGGADVRGRGAEAGGVRGAEGTAARAQGPAPEAGAAPENLRPRLVRKPEPAVAAAAPEAPAGPAGPPPVTAGGLPARAPAAREQELTGRLSQPDGGFSYSPKAGEEPKTGYAVSVHPDRSVVKAAAEITPEDIAQFIVKNMDVLNTPEAHIGGWHDPETGMVHLDISIVTPDRVQAEALGKEHGQLAYFDFQEGKSVRLPEQNAGTQPAARTDAPAAPPAERAGSLAGEGRGDVPGVDRPGTDTRAARTGAGDLEPAATVAPRKLAENLAAFREAIDGLTLADVDKGAIVRVKELRQALANHLPGDAFDQFLDRALKNGDAFVGSRLKSGLPKEIGLSKAGLEKAKEAAGAESAFEEARAAQAQAAEDSGTPALKKPARLKVGKAISAESRVGRGRAALQRQGDAALSRLKSRRLAQANDLTSAAWESSKTFADAVTYGASRIAVAGMDFGQWSVEMVKDLGEGIRPHLEKIFEKAHELIRWRDELYAPERSKRPELANYALRGVADRYAKKYEIDLDPRTQTHAAFDPMRARRIADAYESMLHDPADPRVQASYRALTEETKQQWDHLKEEGYVLEPWTKEGQPYASSVEMRADVAQNKHLYFFQGGDLPADHPLAQKSGVRSSAGELTFNDMFRAVHDTFAHAKEGFEFGPRGEESAWREHYMMFTPDARPALTTETRGQNSWVNFGKHLRTPWGTVPQKGELGFTPAGRRPYAEQKAGILPLEFISQEIPKRKRVEPENVRELRPMDRSVTGIAGELNRYTQKRWGGYSGEAANKAVARAVRMGRKEIEYQLEQQKTGVGWYTHDIAKMEEGVKQFYPSLADSDRMTLFKTVVAASSFGNRPDLNLDTALKIWGEYEKTGKFPARNPENGKNWPGNPGFGTGEALTAQKKLQQLVDERGVEGAASFLRGFQTIADLKKYNQNVAGKQGETRRGFYILGPKGGPFAGNLHGIHENLTADMWFSRTWNRWMGTLIDGEGKTVDAPTTQAQRQQMSEAVEKLADEFNLTTADTQAVLWYYEQQLYKSLGARIEEGSYAAATQKAIDKRGAQAEAAKQGELFPAERAAGDDRGGVRPEDAGPGREASGEREDAGARDRAEGVEEGGGEDLEAQLAQALDNTPEDFSWLDQQADAAAARLRNDVRAESMGLSRLPDLALVGARFIRDGARTIADFTSQLVQSFGSGVSGIARQVWDAALGLLRGKAAGTGGAAAVPGAGVARSGGAGAVAAPGAPGAVPATTAATVVGRSSPIKPIPPKREFVFQPRGKVGVTPPPVSPVEAQVMGDAARDTSRTPIEGKPSPAPGEPQTDVNVSRLSTDKEITDFTARMVESSPERFGRQEGGARGERRDWDAVRRQAVKLGLDGDQVVRAARRKGGFLSDVELEAANIAHEEIARRALDSTQKIAAFKQQGKINEAAAEETLYLKHVSDLATVRYSMIGAKSEAARTLALSRKLGQGLTNEERAYRSFVNLHKDLGEKFQKDFYDAITSKNWAKVNQLQKQAFSPTRLHKILEAWKAGILSGPKTQVVNFLSTGTQVLGSMPVEAAISGLIDATYSKAKGIPDAERERFAGESVAMLKGAHAAMDVAWHGPEGLKQALQDIYDGTFEDKETARQIQRNEELFGRQAIEGKLGTRVRTPFQLLTAADNFWKTIARNQALYREAYRAGKRKSLSGAGLEGFMRQFVDEYATETHGRYDELKSIMERAAEQGTFQQDMPRWARAIGEYANEHPWAGFFIPFVKTPVNIGASALQHTPLGYAWAHKQYKAGKLGKGEMLEMVARATFGTALMAAMYLLMEEADVEITGGGPADFREVANLRDTGWQPYSFRVGDKYVSYQRLDPLSSLIGMMADARELKNTRKVSERLTKGAMLVQENLTNKTFLAGLTGAGRAFGDPNRYLKEWLENFAASWVPAAIGSVAQGTDSQVRQVNNPKDAFLGRIPGVSQTLPPKFSATGEERERVGGEGVLGGLQRAFLPFPVSTIKTGDAADLQREMARIGKVPGAPPKELPVSGGRKIELTEQEQALYAREYEAAARALVRNMKNSAYWRSLPDTDDDVNVPGQMTKERAISNAYRDARARARGQLYQRPEFRRDAERAKRGLSREAAGR